MPKEETCPIPLKYIDVTRSTYTDLDLLKKRRLLEFRFEQAFVTFTERIHKIHSIEMWSGEIDENAGDNQTRSCLARNLDEICVKPFRIEKIKNGPKKKPKLDNARKLRGSTSMVLKMAREMESPRHVFNRRRRTREGPEPKCVRAPLDRRWHTQGRRANQRPAVVPSCRRGKYLQVSRTRREYRAARKGKWSPRGTGTTVLTYPGSAPR